MEHRDYNYYETHAADVNLEEITSSAQNAKNLQQLRDGDPTLSHLTVGRGAFVYSYFGVDDDFGWLAYFIGRSQCLRELRIHYFPEGKEGHELVEGIARNQSIRKISVWFTDDINFCNGGFTLIMRVLHSLPQLEGLGIHDTSRFESPYGWSELRTFLESRVCKLQQLSLRGNYYICDPGVGILSNRLRGIGSSLKVLVLSNNAIGNDGLLAVVEALANNCSSLEKLDLPYNNFSSAEAGLGSLSDWLQRDEVNLKRLNLQYCCINDEGLRVVAQGVANHCEELNLDKNRTITAIGLSYLSSTIRSDSCRVETLHLRGIPIGNDALEVLARGLADNKSVRLLYLDDLDLDNDITVASAGWVAFSTALCDTCSVNSTYLSNRTIIDIRAKEGGEITLPRDISRYLRLHGEHPQYAARCKILMNHPHLDMEPLLHWGLKFLPLAVAWFERSKACTTLKIYDENYYRRLVLEESDETFQSRALTAMYEFVRGMPMEAMKRRKELIVAAHDGNDEIARIDERFRQVLEQRDGKIKQLEEEIKRLKERTSGEGVQLGER